MAGKGRGNSLSRANLSRSADLYTHRLRMIFAKRGNIFLVVENGGSCYCGSFHCAGNDLVGLRVSSWKSWKWNWWRGKAAIRSIVIIWGEERLDFLMKMIFDEGERERNVKFLVQREKSAWSNVSLAVTRMDH